MLYEVVDGQILEKNMGSREIEIATSWVAIFPVAHRFRRSSCLPDHVENTLPRRVRVPCPLVAITVASPMFPSGHGSRSGHEVITEELGL